MRIAIVGAGVIGLACAHALASEGHAVTIVDREGPAAGASGGNAGWLAHTDIEPLASPRMLRRVPQMLLDPLGPLAVRPSYLIPVLPWLTRLLLASRPTELARTVAGLAALQGLAMPMLDSLVGNLDLGGLIHRRGGLFVFADDAALSGAKPTIQRQRDLGIEVELMDGNAARKLEPALTTRVVAAALYPAAAHVSDPRAFTQALFKKASSRGLTFIRDEVRAIRPGQAPTLVLSTSELASDAVVLAAGAWSKALAAGLGDPVPLDTERGYNVSFPGLTGLTSRPISMQGHGFVVTPLDTGLRIGGAVELGGLALPPNHRRTRALYGKARLWLDGLPSFEEGTVWMGFRPSLPDSLPVIGRSTASPHIIHAFGHGHYGLTQSAVTGMLVAGLVAGRAAPIDLSCFDPGRFR